MRGRRWRRKWLAVIVTVSALIASAAQILIAGPAFGSVLYASDAFNRTVTNGWGNADVGGGWNATGGAYGVTPGSASIVAASQTETNFLPSVSNQDVDVLAEITMPTLTSAYVDAGVAARYQASGGTFYQLSVYQASGNNGGNYTVELKRKPDNVQISPDFNTSIPGGTAIWLRLEAQGVSPTALRWRIWAAGSSEPTAWTGTATDNTAALQGPGGIGVEAYASSGTATVGFNSFTASSISMPAPAVTCSSTSIACDTFARSSSDGWGGADVGGGWSGTGPSFGVTPGAATMSADSTAPTTFLSSVSARDVDAEAKISPPPSSNSYVDVGLAVRYSAASGSYYQLSAYYANGNNYGDYVLELKSEPGDQAVAPNINTTIPGGTAIWLRLEAQGANPTTLRWKIWQDGSTEPGGWTSTATDSTPALQTAGAVGVKAYSGSSTQTVAFNGLLVNPIAAPSAPAVQSCPSGVVVCDTFNRTVTNGWGSADSGGAWSASGPNWAVTPGSGTLVADDTAPTNFLTTPSIQDVDAEMKVTPPGISNSYVVAGLGVRYAASSGSFYQLGAYYATGNNSGNYTVSLTVQPSNTAITSNFNTSIPGGQPFWLELQAQGTNPTTLSWRIWEAGTAEPSNWTGTATDSTAALQGPGGLGVKGYVNASTTTIGYNALWASQLSTSSNPQTPPPPAPFACTSGALACDTFNRTVSGGWGTADSGQSWSVSGSSSTWSVSPGAGSVNVAAGGEGIGTLTGPSVQDVEVLGEMSIPTTTSGTTDAYVLGRYTGGTTPTYYRVGVIRSTSEPTLIIRVQRADGSYVENDMPTSVSSGETQPIWLRVQFQGTDPTAIRARVWQQGSQEPSVWDVATTDSTPAMQGAGQVGLRMRNEDSSNAHLFRVEGLQAVALPASSTPAGPASSIDQDTFQRSVSGGWGTADTGGAWSTAGSGYQVTPGLATITAKSTTPTNFLTGHSIQDVDMLARVSPASISSAYVDSGIAVRYVASGGTFYQLSAYYSAGNNAGDYTVQLKRKPANTLIIPDFNTDIPGGTAIWLRLQAQGTNPTTLRWKIWQDGTPEPSSWTGTVTDSTAAMQSAGGIGVEAYANSGTVTMGFNRLTAGGLGS